MSSAAKKRRITRRHRRHYRQRNHCGWRRPKPKHRRLASHRKKGRHARGP